MSQAVTGQGDSTAAPNGIHVEVGNVRRGDLNRADAEYLGRGTRGLTASPLASHYWATTDDDRQLATARYREWLADRIAGGDRTVIGELDRLARRARDTGSLMLVCWCTPKPCHAGVVRDAILALLDTEASQMA
jgi:hypothetical protein